MIAKSNILPDISDHKYSVQIAKTEKEIKEALELRYRVFYKELKREFDTDRTVDKDIFDDQCHHLIVKEISSDKLIGTYRLQTYEQAATGAGFYSDTLFRMNDLPEFILKSGFEVGRACIEESHRNGRVLFLLWKGFAGYLQHFDKRFLFGSLGIPAESIEDGAAVYNRLIDRGYLHSDYLVRPRDSYSCNFDDIETNGTGEAKTTALLQNYIKIGCKICSRPAYHSDLKLLYVMVILDVKTISPKIRRMFFDS